MVAGAVPSHGYPASAAIAVPPLGSVWLRLLSVPSEEQEDEARVEVGSRAAAKLASPAPSRAADATRAARPDAADEAAASPSGPAATTAPTGGTRAPSATRSKRKTR